MLGNLKARIQSDEKLKALVLRLLMPEGQARPRWWVRNFLNRFFHKRGKGSRICSRTRIDVLPFNEFVLGDRSTVEDFVTINNGLGGVIIGNDARIGIGSVLIGPIHIGDNVILAQNIVISAMNHGYEDVSQPIRVQECSKKIVTIGADSWVGANVVITSGIAIGKHSVVAGGSVVTKDVPDFCVAAGNPARIIKQYNPETQIWERVKA